MYLLMRIIAGITHSRCQPLFPISAFYLNTESRGNGTGYTVVQLVAALCYKPEGRGFFPR
jgi:hypothetical protein